MKRIIYFVLFSILPMLTYAQLDVVGPGLVGIGTTNPLGKVHIKESTGQLVIKAATMGPSFSMMDITSGVDGSVRVGAIDMDNNIFGGGVFQAFSNDAPNHKGRIFLDAGSHEDSGIFLRTRDESQTTTTRMAILRYGNVGVGTTSPTTKLHVNGSITYNGSLNNASDKRLKTGINNFRYGLDEVLQLQPVNFRYNGKAGFSNAGQNQVGLVAQDLQKVAPELVSTFTHKEEDEQTKSVRSEDYLMISESSIKYMLINAVKEQQDIIETQKDEIATLRGEVAEMKEMMQTILNGENTELHRQHVELNREGAYLEQNQPNPFNTNTFIKYYIPDGVENAVINIFDTRGILVHSESIRQAGKGEVQIKAGVIATGTYSYSLTVDGQILDTKQMVIAK